jgi:hypothetical protein
MRFLLALVVFVVACHKDDPGPSCAQVVDHVLEVTKQVLPNHETVGMTGDRKASIGQCEARKLPAQARACLFAAKTLDGFGECYKAAGIGGPKPPPRPTPMGSSGSSGSN